MQKKEKKRTSLIVRLAVVAFAVYAAYSLINYQISIYESQRELEEVTEKCNQQELTNQELQRILDNGADQDYIEKIAREKLGLGYPDEKYLVDGSGSR